MRKEVLPVRKEKLPMRKEVLPLRKEVLLVRKEVLHVRKEVLLVRKEVLGLGLGKRELRTAPSHETQHSKYPRCCPEQGWTGKKRNFATSLGDGAGDL